VDPTLPILPKPRGPAAANGRPARCAGVRDVAPWAWIMHDLNLHAFIAKLKEYIPAQS
jgi:hypothetical protein